MKIKDATGKVVGVLKDEDDEPQMVQPKKADLKQEKEEGEEDANTEDADVC